MAAAVSRGLCAYYPWITPDDDSFLVHVCRLPTPDDSNDSPELKDFAHLDTQQLLLGRFDAHRFLAIDIVSTAAAVESLDQCYHRVTPVSSASVDYHGRTTSTSIEHIKDFIVDNSSNSTNRLNILVQPDHSFDYRQLLELYERLLSLSVSANIQVQLRHFVTLHRLIQRSNIPHMMAASAAAAAAASQDSFSSLSQQSQIPGYAKNSTTHCFATLDACITSTTNCSSLATCKPFLVGPSTSTGRATCYRCDCPLTRAGNACQYENWVDFVMVVAWTVLIVLGSMVGGCCVLTSLASSPHGKY